MIFQGCLLLFCFPFPYNSLESALEQVDVLMVINQYQFKMITIKHVTRTIG